MYLSKVRAVWATQDQFVFPGPIQFFGPAAVTDITTVTLQLEQGKKIK